MDGLQPGQALQLKGQVEPEAPGVPAGVALVAGPQDGRLAEGGPGRQRKDTNG